MSCTARFPSHSPQLEQDSAAAEDPVFEENPSEILALNEGCNDRWQTMITLSERILCAKSATRELELWCRQHRIGNGRIVAFVKNDTSLQELDDESLDVLNYLEARRLAKFRHVKLATEGIVVVDALNWYLPTNLTPAMNQQLQTTDIPFGHVVAPLHPWRHTFFVRRCMPDQLAERSSADTCRIAFEHHAVVRAASGAPLAVVHERFLKTLF
jgi:chorismate-pyruvate lyase